MAIDARAPKFDGGIATRLDCVIFGIVVNRDAQRFYDEGEDIWPKRYAIWGRLVAQQPGQIAYSIIDAKSIRLFMPSIFPAIAAPTHRRTCAQSSASIRPRSTKTVADFNAAVRPGTFDHTMLDDCATARADAAEEPLGARNRHAAVLRLSAAPRHHLHLSRRAVNEEARMLLEDGKPSGNMFAAGEIMAGNVLGKGYLAGIGMTIGAVFGRIAGEGAAERMLATENLREAERLMTHLQCLPLLRRAVRGVSGDGDAPHFCGRRPQLSRQSLPPVRRLLHRLPVFAAARVRRQCAGRRWRSCATTATRIMPGRVRSRLPFDRNGLVVTLLAALSIAAFIVGFVAWRDPAALLARNAGDFYKVMPHDAMAGAVRRCRALRRSWL